jgi:hypothetical protein
LVESNTQVASEARQLGNPYGGSFPAGIEKAPQSISAKYLMDLSEAQFSS